jgi:predicted flap endonuclease-1-like 5' DNA nuclease
MALRDDLIEEDRCGTARRTLAMRIAQRNRLRAERLARLRPAADPEPPMPAPDMTAPPGSALEEFLRALTRAPERPAACAVPAPRIAAAPVSAPDFDIDPDMDADTVLGAEAGFEPAPTAVLPFERRAVEAAVVAAPPPGAAGDCDLATLDGAGPGLVWALRRAGLATLADVAALEPEALAARLGPLGRLVPARAWVEAARAAVPD